jgi:hypothetical protein
MHTVKQSMCTGNHVKNHVCQHILYFGIGGKAACANTTKHIFREESGGHD